MHFKFEKLQIWQIAMENGESINELAKTFPIEEKYNLNSQIRRAMDRVALHISEGAIGDSNRELNKFVGYSIRSLAEVVTCLYKAKNRNYINDETFKIHYNSCYNLMNMLISFKKSIK